MVYISLTILSGIVSGILSIWFRSKELRKKVILMHKQLFSQIALFFVFAIIFAEFFSYVSIDLWFFQMGWLLIYVLFSSASYYGVQVFYEYFSGNKLFATEKEMKEYLEKLENERDKF